MNERKESLSVLVADDDEDDRAFIRKAWAKSRVANDLHFVEDGEELIEFLTQSGRYSEAGSAPRPAVILLDLNMPKKDGREALREIKADPELRQIPVIVLTTSQADEDICRSYDLGANSYITKPVTFEALVEVLQVLGKYWIEIVDVRPSGNQTTSQHLDVIEPRILDSDSPLTVKVPTKPVKETTL